jgi:thioredoxin-dependent peroxiredoxin
LGIEVGDRIEDVGATADDGRHVTLSELADGRPLVVFFYPKAFTGGCTAQACHFRDLGAEFDQLGARLVGVSRDDADTQAEFGRQHGFGYPLLADPDGEVARAFGARRLGPLPNRRQTYVLDADLRLLARVSSEIDMERHADEALDVLRQHTGSSTH